MSRPVSPVHGSLSETVKASEGIQVFVDKAFPEQAYDRTKQTESRFLEPPQYRTPHRPLSPDTLSNLSADEFDQLGPRNDEPSIWLDGGHHITLKPSWTSKWQARLHATWIRNAGLFYMLLAQVFGVMMNVTTRLLEIEGNKGKGLHPFQVRNSETGPHINDVLTSKRFCSLACLLLWYSHLYTCGTQRHHTFHWDIERSDGSW
jgi:hypothetical protein